MTSNNQEAIMKKVTVQDGESADIVQDNLQHLKALFPEAFTENGINFDTLRQLLGDLKVLDEGEEKYGLNWHGKKQARHIAQIPSLGTLLPCPEESVDWDTTQNLFIEGDNLEVLKLLQKSYANKIKMIYIDPPYNTGKEFIYPDKFQDNLDTYLKYTGQKGEDGLKFTSNTEAGGRKHTNWLNMMYPRLKLARNLLREDGVVFISIDDNEQANLKKICDEIFGEENFRNKISIRRGAKSVQAQFDTWDKLGQDAEYILFYTKNSEYRFPKQFKNMEEPKDGSWNNHWRGTDRPTMRYSIFDIKPENGQWRWGKDRSLKAINNYKKMLSDLGESENTITQNAIDRYYLSQSEEIDLLRLSKTKKPEHYIPPRSTTLLNSSWEDLLVGSSSEILNLFESKVFDTAKLTKVIKRMLGFCEQDSIILDFFAGSATTAHAVMQLNAEDGGNRRHISVQLPEPCDEKSEAFKAGYKNIAEISKERIRRAAKKIKDDNPEYKGDLGFKVFKLANTNIKAWNPDRTDLEKSLLDHQEHLIEGRSEQDILYELLLKRGVDLTTPIVTREIACKNVYSIGYGKIITCLDDWIAGDDVEPLAAGMIAWQKELKATLGIQVLETHVFFKDSAFRDDVAKTNMAAILSQNGINHVRSL